MKSANKHNKEDCRLSKESVFDSVCEQANQTDQKRIKEENNWRLLQREEERGRIKPISN
jgi:hypothetical protein